MSYELMGAAMAETDMSSGAKLVLLALANCHNGKTGACFPGLNHLADKCCMNRSTVTRHLNELERTGRMTRQRAFTAKGRPRSTQYELHLSGAEQLVQNEPTAGATCNSSWCDMHHRAGARCNPNQEHTNQEDNQEDNQLARDARGNDGGDGFDTFWSRYPRKVGKGAARKVYARAVKKASHDELMSALDAQLPAMEAKASEYRPHPATWLKQERWTDEPQSRPKDAMNGQGSNVRVTKDGKRQVWHPFDGWMTEHC